MKQLLNYCVVMMLAICLFGCTREEAAPQPTPVPLAGSYRLIQMVDQEGSDVTEDLEMLGDVGLTVTLELNEDGTGTMNMFSENADITWTETEIVMNGQSIPLTFEDGVLTLADTRGGKSILIFKAVDPEGAEKAEETEKHQAG